MTHEGFSIKFNDDPIPIDQILVNKEPVYDGLYAHEILALSYAHKYYPNSQLNHFDGFWLYEYGISDMNELLDSLRDRGFLDIGSLPDALYEANFNDLRKLLKNQGMKASGNKSTVISNLLSVMDIDDLRKLYPNYPYILTNRGTMVLSEKPFIEIVHKDKRYNLSIWDVDIFMTNYPNKTFYEAMEEYAKQTELKWLIEYIENRKTRE